MPRRILDISVALKAGIASDAEIPARTEATANTVRTVASIED
jgi:hypothetical protein